MRIEDRAQDVLSRARGGDATAFELATDAWAAKKGWRRFFAVDVVIQREGAHTTCALTREGEVLGLGSARCSSQDENIPMLGNIISLWRALDATQRAQKLEARDSSPAPGVAQAGIRDARADFGRGRSNIFGPELEAGGTAFSAAEVLDPAFGNSPTGSPAGEFILNPARGPEFTSDVFEPGFLNPLDKGVSFFIERGAMQRANSELFNESAGVASSDQADGFGDTPVPDAFDAPKKVDLLFHRDVFGWAMRPLQESGSCPRDPKISGLKAALGRAHDSLAEATARLHAEERKVEAITKLARASHREAQELGSEIDKLARFIREKLGGPHVEGSVADQAIAYLEGAHRCQVKLLDLVTLGLKLVSDALRPDACTDSVSWTWEASRFRDEAGAALLRLKKGAPRAERKA